MERRETKREKREINGGKREDRKETKIREKNETKRKKRNDKKKRHETRREGKEVKGKERKGKERVPPGTSKTPKNRIQSPLEPLLDVPRHPKIVSKAL